MHVLRKLYKSVPTNTPAYDSVQTLLEQILSESLHVAKLLLSVLEDMCVVHGGVVSNMVAPHARAELDLRFTADTNPEDLLARVRAVLRRRADNGTSSGSRTTPSQGTEASTLLNASRRYSVLNICARHGQTSVSGAACVKVSVTG